MAHQVRKLTEEEMIEETERLKRCEENGRRFMGIKWTPSRWHNSLKLRILQKRAEK